MDFGLWTISIIGVGKLGGALAIALTRCGYKVETLISRDLSNAERIANVIKSESNSNFAPQVFHLSNLEQVPTSDVVFITTPDPQIKVVAEMFAKREAKSPAAFFHTSGSLSSDVLANLREHDVYIGSLHPLVSISNSETGANRFENAYFCVEGDSQAVKIAEKIVEDLRGQSFSIAAAKKSLYHAAAVMSSGHVVTLFDLATKTLIECGLNAEDAAKILLPLLKSTVENLQSQTPAAALTGTFARADVAALRRHIESFRLMSDGEAFAAYIELGKHALKLAAQQGANSEKLLEMSRILDDEAAR